MLHNQISTSRRTITNINQEDEESPIMRDIHALDPPTNHDRRLSSISRASSSSTEFTTISHEFNALVLAGSRIRPENHSGPTNLGRIGEDQNLSEENNSLAIVLDQISLGEITVERVKKVEVESKINVWENAKIAKINNRFKKEEVLIRGWEEKKVDKASSWMKEVERKLEEKRAKASEKMQNEIVKAHRKAEERKASNEANRGIKVARVVEIANFMRDMGRAPAKRSCFCCCKTESSVKN